MVALNIVLLLIPSLLAIRGVGGAEFLDAAPVLQHNQASFYFLLFEKETEVQNNFEFSIFKDNDFTEESRYFKVICREVQGVKSMDIITYDENGEHQVLVDTVFVESCTDFEDVYHSMAPLTPEADGREVFLFADVDGKCYQRTYGIQTLQFTAIVDRSAVGNPISCPEKIQQNLKEHEAAVKGFSPPGLSLQTFFIDKPDTYYEEVPITVPFPGAPDFQLVCVATKLRYEDPAYQQHKDKDVLLTATVKYQGVPLDRFKLNHDGSAFTPEGCTACNVDNIVPETVDTGEGKVHYITYKIAGKTEKREYKLTIKPETGYKIVKLERRPVAVSKQSEKPSQKV